MFESGPCVIIILGMHDSGASSLAGCLQKRGLYLGQVTEGDRENPEITRLNESLLAHNGGSWDRPPEAITWSGEQVSARDGIIESYLQQSVRFGFSDPRTLLTLSFWEDALLPAKYVATFRDPLSVAKSLRATKGLDIGEGVRLWKQYNARLLRCCEGRLLRLVCSEVSSDEYLQRVNLVASRLGLGLADSGLDETDSFFGNPSVETPEERSVVPTDVMDLYEALKAIYRRQLI